MEWLNWLIWYLVAGILLGEGLLHDCKRKRQKPDAFEYVIAVLIGPAIVPIVLLKNLIWRKRK